MKRTVMSTMVALIVVGTIIAAKANNKRVAVNYTISDNTANCRFGDILPGDCLSFNVDGTLCTAQVGVYTKTYYQGTSCVTPYYRLP